MTDDAVRTESGQIAVEERAAERRWRDPRPKGPRVMTAAERRERNAAVAARVGALLDEWAASGRVHGELTIVAQRGAAVKMRLVTETGPGADFRF